MQVAQEDDVESNDKIRTLQVELKGQILLNMALIRDNEKLHVEVMKALEKKFEASFDKVSRMNGFGKNHNREGLDFRGKLSKNNLCERKLSEGYL